MGLLSDYADQNGGAQGLFGSAASLDPSLLASLAAVGLDGSQSVMGAPYQASPMSYAPDTSQSSGMSSRSLQMPDWQTMQTGSPPQSQIGPAADPAAGAPQLQAPIPQQIHMPGVNPILGVLDRVFLHGAGEAVQNSNYRAHVANAQSQYQHDAALYQQQRLQQFGQSLPDSEKPLFYNDPQGYITQRIKNEAPIPLSEGQTALFPGGAPQGTTPNGSPSFTAPKLAFDPQSGRGLSVGSGGILSTGGPQLGGDISAKDGLLVSGRQGAVGTYTQPQVMAPGSVPGVFMPTVNGGSSAGPAGAPMVGGGVAPNPMNPPMIGQAAPRGVRNNNLTNLKSLGGGAQWPGQTGTDADGYAVFGSPQAGMAAAGQNLSAYATKHGINTVSSLVSRWSPGAPSTYAPFVASQLGVDPNQQVDFTNPQTQQQTLSALAQFENGQGSKAPSGPVAINHPSQSGFNVGKPVGAGYQIVHGASVPNGDPNLDYKIGPNGDISPISRAFTMDNVASLRDKYLNEKTGPYQAAQAVVGPMKSVFSAIDSMAPNGVVQMGLNDALNKAFNPGGVIRASTMRMTLEHFGLPNEAIGEVENAVGHGFMSPAVVKQMGRTLWSYAKTHVDQANQRAQQDGDFVKNKGYDPSVLNEPTSTLPPVPLWAQDPKPIKPVVGQTYWTPQGPMKFTKNGYSAQ